MVERRKKKRKKKKKKKVRAIEISEHARFFLSKNCRAAESKMRKHGQLPANRAETGQENAGCGQAHLKKINGRGGQPRIESTKPSREEEKKKNGETTT
jgi:hypothetical protein